MFLVCVYILAPHLPQGSKSRSETCVCTGAIFDPCGKFRESSRSGVTSVAQHNGRIVTTVTDSSSFEERKSNTHPILTKSLWNKQVAFYEFLL